MSIPTVVPEINSERWAQRLVNLFPRGWASDAARSKGGVLYSLMKAIGTNLEVNDAQLIYAFKTTRIATAIDEGLDTVASDFFGSVAGYPADIQRAPGEPDESFRTRIKSALLLPAGTRQALILLLQRLTGTTPRVMEPWNLLDTGAYDCISYYDVDTPQNPSRYGDPGLRYQGFIETSLPTFGNQGNNPVYAYDSGAFYDSSGYYINAQPSWWINSKRVDDLINKTKPWGTRVWRRYRRKPLTAWPLSSMRKVPVDGTGIPVTVFPAFAGLYTLIANANWNTGIYWKPISNSDFIIEFSTPAPPGSFVDWLAAPLTWPGVGFSTIESERTDFSIGVPSTLPNYKLFVTPTWNTEVWLDHQTTEQAYLRCSVPAAQQSSFSYMWLPPEKCGIQGVEIDETTKDVTIPFALTGPFRVFVLPNWNTKVQIVKSETGFTASFSQPAPENAQFNWAIHTV